MSAEALSNIEAAAFAIYSVFIRDAAGTRRYAYDPISGQSLPETPDMAVERRWEKAPQTTRDEFMAYAQAAKPYFEAGGNDGRQ